MSRYIDVDALLKRARFDSNRYERVVSISDIYLAPSIDLVCCGECSKRKKNRFCLEHMRYEKDDEGYCSYGSRSEKPNNCEHITEDGVTCAKYPACDDCLDNPLNKIKGSERLVKGSEQTDCQTCKWWSSYGYCVHRECKGYEPKTERSSE